MPSPTGPTPTATDGSQMLEGHDTLAASGAFTSPGSLVLTAGADALAAPSRFTATGAIARTSSPDPLAGGAVFTATAGLTRTEGADSGGITGDNDRIASLAVQEAHDGLAAPGWCIIASIARSESPDVLAAPAGLTAAAAIGRTETGDALASSSTDIASAALGQTGGADALAAAGNARVHGSVVAISGSDVLAAAGSGGHYGLLGRTESADTLAAAAPFGSSAALAVAAPGDDRLMTGSTLEYHVYANGGAGAIDYATPVATTGLLTWTSGVLSCGSDWRFGVRCFDPGSGLEEENIDCAVEIILDAGCTDITNRPAPPFGLRAFAVAP